MTVQLRAETRVRILTKVLIAILIFKYPNCSFLLLNCVML